MPVNIITVFILAGLISFFGSLPPGAVNLEVIRVGAFGNRRAVLLVSMGGSLPEILYAGLAILFTGWLNLNPGLLKIMHLVTIPALLTAGILSFVRKPASHEPTGKKNKRFFWGAFLLAVFNPLLLVFWTAAAAMLAEREWLSPGVYAHQAAFAFGAAAGAFFALLFLGWLVRIGRKRLSRLFTFNMNRVTGLIFIFLALVDLVKLFRLHALGH